MRRASLTSAARNTLVADLDIPVVSPEDMYGGKLVAALDRQHPRDSRLAFIRRCRSTVCAHDIVKLDNGSLRA